jgi:hypothetical protein
MLTHRELSGKLNENLTIIKKVLKSSRHTRLVILKIEGDSFIKKISLNYLFIIIYAIAEMLCSNCQDEELSLYISSRFDNEKNNQEILISHEQMSLLPSKLNKLPIQDDDLVMQLIDPQYSSRLIWLAKQLQTRFGASFTISRYFRGGDTFTFSC